MKDVARGVNSKQHIGNKTVTPASSTSSALRSKDELLAITLDLHHPQVMVLVNGLDVLNCHRSWVRVPVEPCAFSSHDIWWPVWVCAQAASSKGTALSVPAYESARNQVTHSECK